MIHLYPGGTGARVEIQFCPPPTLSPEASLPPAAVSAATVTDGERDPATRLGTPSLAIDTGNGKSAESSPREETAEGANTATRNGRGGVEGGGVGGGASDGYPAVALYAGLVEEVGPEDDGLGLTAEGLEGQHGAWAGVRMEPWSRHGRWRVPCFFKQAGVATASDGHGENINELPPLALEVRENRTQVRWARVHIS